MQAALVERGVWLRPFGKLLYAMPPYVISEDELRQVTDAMRAVLEELA
jgi:adenosylmethionine-8-amino-7-oxononanoate aminotransferase